MMLELPGNTTQQSAQVVTLRQKTGVAIAPLQRSLGDDPNTGCSTTAPSQRTSRGYLSPPSILSVGNTSSTTHHTHDRVGTFGTDVVSSNEKVVYIKSEPIHPCDRGGRAGSTSAISRPASNICATNPGQIIEEVIPTHCIVQSPGDTTQQELDYLGTPEEVTFIQEFARNVAVWMDAFDKDYHFSRILPHQALKSPMLLNAALACGAKHLAASCAEYHDKALSYYDTASSQLLRNLQNPDRNTSECAVTVQVLYVYEVMCREPFYRMKHVGGARAVIKECGWNAGTTGIGHACFWLNVSMEIINCLAMNWPLTWNPDEWGAKAPRQNDASQTEPGQEAEWLHGILFVVAKVVNFRAQNQFFHRSSPREENVVEREAEWKQLKRQCDEWVAHCPTTMHPVGYIAGRSTELSSMFPKVW